MPNCKISITIEVESTDWHSVSLKNLCSLKEIPKGPGTYLLHHGPLFDAWPTTSVFYIGAAYAEGLWKRARKHRSVLLGEKTRDGENDKIRGSKAMKEYRESIGHKIDDVYFSYILYEKDVKPYIPFVVESELLIYFKKHNNDLMPQANRGQR